MLSANAQRAENNKLGLITPRNPNAYSTIIVTDAAGDAPLVGATVEIIHKKDRLTTTTQKIAIGPIVIAYCFYEKTPQDSVELRVSYVGYKPFIRKYAAFEFKGTKRVQLLDDVTAISQIVIVGEQIAMVLKGDTTVYNASSFKTLEGDRFRELLKQLPGVEVKNNKIYAAGEEIKRVYVDGRNLFGDNPEYVLSDLTADNVRSVKVYNQPSAEAKYLGDDKAKEEKVMNVATYSRPDVIRGGDIAAVAGISLGDKARSQEKLRYELGANLYRNTERGNQRLGLRLDKNVPALGSAANQSVNPGTRQEISIGNSLRRGDSTIVSTTLAFRRNTQENRSTSVQDYLPNQDYSERSQNASTAAEGDNYTLSLDNSIQRLRRGNLFTASLIGRLNKTASIGRNYTMQQINDSQMTTDQHSRGDDSGGSLGLRVMNSLKMTSRSFLLVDANLDYNKSTQGLLSVDTTASNRLMRTIIDNNTGSHNLQTGASATAKVDLGKFVSLGLLYKFDYKYAKSRRSSIDYIDNPVGNLDLVNSYNYTINSYRNTVAPHLYFVKGKLHFDLELGFQAYNIASDEQLPIADNSKRGYYSLLPSLNVYYATTIHNLRFDVRSSAEELSLEQIRRGIDVTNPLFLHAGNPDLRQTKSYSATLRYQYTDIARSSTYSFNVSGNFRADYSANKSTLFLEQTYLPKYDYTAQRGAQLNEIVNADGCYGWQANVGYSKRIKIGWTLKAQADYSFDRAPYFIGGELSYAKNNTGRLVLSAISGFSTKVKIEFDSASELSYYDTQNQLSKQFIQNFRAEVRAVIRKHNTLTVNTSYRLYRNYSVSGVDRDDILTNVSIGRKIGKKRKLELSIGVVDLFNRINNTKTLFTENYVSTKTNFYLGRYGYIRAAYQF